MATATDKNQALSTLRGKIQGETLANEGRNRFALFSQPPAGVWGNGDYNFNKTKSLGTDGKVKTQPRGIFSGPGSSGKVESSYFSKSGYVTIGDKYTDPASVQRQAENAKKKNIKQDTQFRSSDNSKSDPFNALFPHMDKEYKDVKKEFRGADGKVVVPPRNIMTNPPKQGHGNSTIGHLIKKNPEHIPDPYNRPKELLAKEREEAKKKLQEQPFRSNSHGGNNFTNVKQTFGRDDKVLMRNVEKPKTSPAVSHEAPFRPSNPSKIGYNKTIGKFPEYKPDPIRFAVKQVEDPNKKDSFRPNNTAHLARPTPSISLNKINLKNDMARISRGL